MVKDSVETRIHKFLKKKYGSSSEAKSGDSKETNDGLVGITDIGPLGNVASEKPKSKILAEEFDILFGVKTAVEEFGTSLENGDSNMPDAATSAGFV